MEVPAELRRTGRCAEPTHTDPGDVADVRQLSRPHGTACNDFERLDRSRYRLRPDLATGSDYQDERLDHGTLAAGHGTTVTRRNHRTVGPDAGSPITDG